MPRKLSTAMAMTAAITTMGALALAATTPLHARSGQETAIDGRCQYTDELAHYRHETTLILCDSATISRAPTGATLDFRQHDWGSMARFTGDMPAAKMTVTQVTPRDGRSLAATGTCEIFYSNARLSAIRCLAKAGTRSFAANFVASRL